MSRDGWEIVGVLAGFAGVAGAVAIGSRIARGRGHEPPPAPPTPSPPPRPARGGASSSTPPGSDSVPSRVVPARFDSLVERWRAEVAKRAGDLPVDALLQWIASESGGDIAAKGLPNEAGIWQLMFPDDAKYGTTLAELQAIAAKSNRPGFTLAQLAPAEIEAEVGAGIRKAAAAREAVRSVFASSGVRWPETSMDFGAAVKQIHALPAVIAELVPKIAHASGPPVDWAHLRAAVMAFPPSQMSDSLRRFAFAPSTAKPPRANRIEDTMANAEEVGRAWGPPMIAATRSTV